jgi:hypothetical protein
VIIDLVGPDEIAARLEVRSNTVSTWRARGLLPVPVAVVSRVPLWPWPVIRAWADATRRLGSHCAAPKASRDEVNAARAVVLAELDALADEATGILDLCGVSAMIRKAPAREAMRDGSGRFRSLDGRGSYAGEWDWYFQLSQRDRDWLARSHQGPGPHLSAPDQVAECMAKFTGTAEVDRCMAEWLRCVRIIDAAAAVGKRVPWRRCAHLFTGVAATSYDVAALFGPYAEAASYLAGLREEPSDDEEPRPLIARLGPSPLDMDFDEWRDELRELEARASSIENVSGEWEVLSAEDQRILDRFEELLPSVVASVVPWSLEDLYVAVVGAYLDAVA